MQQTCIDCSKSFDIPKDDQRFYQKIDVPPPRCCPHCRFVRRLNERNSRVLYKRKCDLTGDEFISPYHTDHVFPVYTPEAWWGDGWDPMDYGVDFDFSRSFFEQFGELMNRVPHQGQFVISGTMENCDYVNCAGYIKNCYLIAEADYDENCYYGNRLFHNVSLVDCSNCYEDQFCYECIDCRNCNNTRYSQDSENCFDSFFLRSCIGCRDCISCINQQQKQYMIFNKQLSKDEYEAKKAEMKLDTYSGIQEARKEADEFFLKYPQKDLQNKHNENCSGNYLYDSKNSFECYDCKDLEDCKYCARVFSVKSSMDYTSWGDKSECMYQSAACGDNGYNLKFCTTCTTNNTNLEYCGHCTGCSDCFGCVGLKRKKYCICNKQFSQEGYVELKEKIITHMRETGEYGEYFPKELCPYGYNETLAQECFPLTKEEAIAKGYKWRDGTKEVPDVTKIIPAERLPEKIEDIPEDVINWAITCERSGRPFRIIKQEYAFYRKMQIPIPHLHPDERHSDRIERRNPPRLWKRECGKCRKEMQTTYAPDRPETVFCEDCYLKVVY